MKHWIVLLALLISCAQAFAQENRPTATARPLEIGAARWTDGFWADRLAVCRQRSHPAMWEIMRGDQYKPFLLHFQIAAGQRDGDYHGAPWNDGDFYKFLEATASLWALEPEPRLAQVLDESIDVIAAAQRSDGYIHTPVLIRQRNGDAAAAPFSDRADFEMYNMGHLLTAACLHHRVTGSDAFLDVARRTADFLASTFSNPTAELARNSVCPSHYMGAIDMYRATGERRYLDLAQKFLDMRNLVVDGGDDNQDRIPFLDQREAVGHAVRANYLYAGAADLYLETGDERLWAPLEACWRSVVERKMYVTGGCGALYDGASPDGSENQAQISRVHQAYGRNYQLPQTTAHNETCAAIGSVLWNWRMFLATGDAKYVDVLELALYNSVLAGVSLSGEDYFYVNPLRQVEPLPAPLRWPRRRVPFVVSYCCPPNVLRTIAQSASYAYAAAEDGAYVNLYGSSTLSTTHAGEPLKLSQTTEYPWDGRVRIAIEACPSAPFALHVRIPGWSGAATVRINGRPLETFTAPGAFAKLHRKWSPGDVVDIDLPMPATLLEAHPLVEEARNHVAVKRGPVVYCLESPDLPDDVRVDEAVAPADVEFTVRRDRELLGGVAVLEAQLAVRPAGDWDGVLYRPRTRAESRLVRTQLIPYYAWSNRGDSEMTVWIPAE